MNECRMRVICIFETKNDAKSKLSRSGEIFEQFDKWESGPVDFHAKMPLEDARHDTHLKFERMADPAGNMVVEMLQKYLENNPDLIPKPNIKPVLESSETPPPKEEKAT